MGNHIITKNQLNEIMITDKTHPQIVYSPNNSPNQNNTLSKDNINDNTNDMQTLNYRYMKKVQYSNSNPIMNNQMTDTVDENISGITINNKQIPKQLFYTPKFHQTKWSGQNK